MQRVPAFGTASVRAGTPTVVQPAWQTHRPSVAARAKKDLQPKKGPPPKWYRNAKVIFNGEVVMTVCGTQPEYHVDVWSGNHPFYNGVQKTLVTDEGRLAKFRAKYEGIDMLTMLPEEMAEEVDPNASDEEDDVYLAPPPKSKKGAGKSSKQGKKKK